MHGYKDAPDTTFVGSSVRKGYRAILESYRKHYAGKAQMGELTFSDLDVRLLPGLDGEVRYAVVTGRFHLDRAAHGEVAQDDGVFSLLWEKTADGWKIILDHTS
jgi:ketosteroid isomerase-like protein